MLPTNHTTNSSNFYPEFLQYSKEAYEQQQSNGQICNKKKKRTNTTDSIIPQAKDEHVKLSSTEIRRQIHIQSEQKRRAQIKDGFEDLRNELPSCLNKKMSKVALLHRSKSFIVGLIKKKEMLTSLK
jgi:hypothetical protein